MPWLLRRSIRARPRKNWPNLPYRLESTKSPGLKLRKKVVKNCLSRRPTILAPALADLEEWGRAAWDPVEWVQGDLEVWDPGE